LAPIIRIGFATSADQTTTRLHTLPYAPYGTVNMDEKPLAILVSFNMSVPMSALTCWMRPDIGSL
jgi:hypothetical protein